MKLLALQIAALLFFIELADVSAAPARNADEASVTTNYHFDYKTENGQERVEDIKYGVKNTKITMAEDVTMKPVEYRGGYSFISADGYEYQVKFKANKNGFQPYVTAHKLSDK